ncbi:MAG: hypothetical protein IOC02_14500 [Methylobacterium sp.]|nr:hypothetical protein [Methylobacterium sp.]MCA3685309.1 hypothetical protein [Methylobacterium sp.]
MDPLTIASAAFKGAGALMSMFGARSNFAAAQRITRQKQATLRQNADMAMMRSTFEQNRIDDQIDATTGAQVNYFAGGNLDPSSGSPAVLQAMTTAQGETDKMLAAARGAQERADAFQQISDLESGLGAQRRAMSWGIGTSLLETAGDLTKMFGPKIGSYGSSGGMGGDNSFARARRINNFQGWGV